MKLVALTASQFGGLRWVAPKGYSIAAVDTVAALVVQEVPRAVLSMPIAFVPKAEEFTLVALQGLQQGKNLFVTADGRWGHGYIPAVYRSYPFMVANTEGGEQVLCFDEDSKLLTDGEGQLFYEADGQLSGAVKQIADFLKQVIQNRGLTAEICRLLQQRNLIKPWNIAYNDGSLDQKLEGLYGIDEDALKNLAAEDLKQLHDIGALSVAYFQLLSGQNLPKLIEMSRANLAASAQKTAELDFLVKNEGSLDFSSL
jgi:hypothetical protein